MVSKELENKNMTLKMEKSVISFLKNKEKIKCHYKYVHKINN